MDAVHVVREVLSASRIRSMTRRKVALSVPEGPSEERGGFNAIPTTTGLRDAPIWSEVHTRVAIWAA